MGSKIEPKNLNLSKYYSDEEKGKFLKLFHGFSDVFAWSYKDLKGYDPSIVSHAIPLRKELFPIIKKQRPLNLALEAIIRVELDNLIAFHIIFPIKYSKWVANLDPIRNKNGQIHLCVEFKDLNKESVKDNYPLRNMKLILQHACDSQMILLLDGFSGYN